MGFTQLVRSESKIEQELNHFYDALQKEPSFQPLQMSTHVVLFLSMGCRHKRADVFQVNHSSMKKAWKTVKKEALQKISQYKRAYEWFKIDVVENEEILSIDQFIHMISETKKNYFRKGISFDKHYQCAFLEQELNGNAVIQLDEKSKRGFIQERNLQHYIKQHRPTITSTSFLHEARHIRLFTTRSFFFEKGRLYSLKSTDLDNGRRDVQLDDKHVKDLIVSSSTFLANQVQQDGRFTYGYFSCFDKEIQFYNILRHASTLYSMSEAYELFPNEQLKQSIKRGIAFLKNEGSRVYEVNGTELAYMIDGQSTANEEIKLGANAAAILALTKYQEVFDDSSYLPFAQKLADGILHMQHDTGRFDHVLYASSLEVKEAFRIIYYDGEAAFALMRLYALDKQQKWIETVERAFSYFIAKKHWRHHDHWLSYCTNELTKYRPKHDYFLFGLKNVSDKLPFIYQRQTTYPTFLELTLAGWNMTERMKNTGYGNLLRDDIQSRLEQTVHKRAEYQRNGYFYPEMAMYFKNPERILNSFFIRHHSFRSRIDDTEHYLSGYCAYYTFLVGKHS
ncbi:hypothetical protein [Alkalicoccobacillus porphyridii]|uniref:Poly(Glycerol-phosphate) alpha-glucosyltransferase n=1 Tax=Alkalicoccobacillus porphyridii TaxID=2597270 RepID=A0A554A4C3_9BACI|nr:hypothetical protein [Alkalicoccobacillus porphyridii]TSB48525.1 hypothetical protein FN960_02935 [Alkalicoccobacillus porphyridii]